MGHYPRSHTPALDGPAEPTCGLRVAGLFAGIGGVEHGLHAAGHRTAVLCEVDAAARRVLAARFPDIELLGDIRSVTSLPRVEVVAAGFPCQDLSQAGRTAGIGGTRSSLVGEVFRLLDSARPRWLLLENVPFMLRLERGRAMHYLTSALSERRYRWAYRVVDTRAFGLPQRRRRVVLLASRRHDPRPVLFADEAGAPGPDEAFSDRQRAVLPDDTACGFYWTEGVRGLGWAVDATPTLKGGSTVGIPSPPAIVMPTGAVGTPDIRDAERLQGFSAGWTEPAVDDPGRRNGPRWRLVGNAVSVPVARWLGENLANPGRYRAPRARALQPGEPWPIAAWSMGGPMCAADVSHWPRRESAPPLAAFPQFPMTPLSLRATAGFRARAGRSSLRFPDGFLDVIDAHLRAQQTAAAEPG